MIAPKCTHCGFDLTQVEDRGNVLACPECGVWNRRAALSQERSSHSPESRTIAFGVGPTIALVVLSFLAPGNVGSVLALLSIFAAMLGPLGAMCWYWRQLPRRWNVGVPLALTMYGILVIPVAVVILFEGMKAGAGVLTNL